MRLHPHHYTFAILRLAVVLVCLTTLTAWTAPTSLAATETANPKYIIVFVGDGMGFQQKAMATALLRAQSSDPTATLQMDAIPLQGELTTWLKSTYITDSAAAGTAMFTGHLTGMGVIGMAGDKKTPLPSVLEWSLASNRRVGVISDVSLDHATPAAIYAHAASRNNYALIAEQMASSDIHYFGGGGLKASQAEGDAGKAGKVFASLQEKGYRIITSRDALQQTADLTAPVFATNPRLDRSAAMVDAQDLQPTDMDLAFLTGQAIRLLKQEDENQQGFFLMVEGGKVDWKGHANESVGLAQQVLAMDAAVGVALEFAAQHPEECLLIVTADHETGDLRAVPAPDAATATAIDPVQQAAILRHLHATSWQAAKKALSSIDATGEQAAQAIRDLLIEHLAITDGSEQEIAGLLNRLATLQALPADADKKVRRKAQHDLFQNLQDVLGKRIGFRYTSGGHSNQPVPVLATGPGADRFQGQQRIHLFGQHLQALLSQKQ